MVERLAKLIKEAKGVVILTGAGISTNSGIPDFRGKDGLWTKINPMKTLHATIMKDEPEVFYKHYFDFHDGCMGKQPNDGHTALASLEKKGYIKGIVTQNIDGLHQDAGSENVIEVHGTVKTCHCLKCGTKFSYDFLKDKVNSGNVPPTCPGCNGVLRPDVVLFGDLLPELDRAEALVDECDLLIAIGSSLTVWPVASLVGKVKRVVIINKDETPFDHDYTTKVIIKEDISEVLKKLDGLLE